MNNPSPACEVKVGAAAYVSTTDGVDMTPSETIIIRLASQTDVDSWLIECITTDDTSSASAVTASLTIDSTNKTATFTAPSDTGKAYRFRSRVNGGIDRNGVAQSSYTTTFCLYTTVTGRRVIATDETTEGDSTFGWTKWLNDMIRDFGSGGGGGGGGGAVGVDYQFQYYSGGSQFGASGLDYDPTSGRVIVNRGLQVQGTAVATLANAHLVAGTAATGFRLVAPVMQGALVTGVATMSAAMLVAGTAATGFHLVAPVMLGPILGGTTVFTGTDTLVMGLSDHQPISAVRNLTTTNATVTPIFAFKPKDEAITSVVVEANAIPSGGAAAGSYVRRAGIHMNGGVGTCGPVEASYDLEFPNSGFTGLSIGSGIHIGVSGATGFVNVKGTATGSIKWGVTITMQTTSWA